MSFDALLTLIPDSPWVTVIALIVIVYLLVERVTNFSTNFVDRRSDKQLLEQASLAASVLEKLPEDHRTRSAILSYIGTGPIAELTARQQNRAIRKQDAQRRNLRRYLLAGAFGLVALAYVPELPEYYTGIAAGLQEPDSNLPAPLMYLFATTLFVLFILLASLLMFAFMMGSYKLTEWILHRIVEPILKRARAHFVRTDGTNGRKV